MKVGGRGKAAILELQTALVGITIRRGWRLRWEGMAKRIASCFLDKDPLVQQALWRACNCPLLEALQTQGGKEETDPVQVFLPKGEERLLEVLKVGGAAMYKELPRYCRLLPATSPLPSDPHKGMVNKLNFMRKLLGSLLLEEDENELRAECYYHLASLFVTRGRALREGLADEKKGKEVAALVGKLEKEAL